MSMNMRITDFDIVQEELPHDDYTLIKYFNKLKEEIAVKKTNFDHKRSSANDDDYLDFAMARLAYEFAKEEYDIVLNEAKKRRLITG